MLGKLAMARLGRENPARRRLRNGVLTGGAQLGSSATPTIHSKPENVCPLTDSRCKICHGTVSRSAPRAASVPRLNQPARRFIFLPHVVA